MPPQKEPLKDTLTDTEIEKITASLAPKRQEREVLGQTLSQAQSKASLPESGAKDLGAQVPTGNSELIKPLRTYQNDVAEAVRAKNESVVSISLAEKKRKEDRGEYSMPSSGTGRNRVVISFLSLILLLTGGLVLFIVIQNSRKPEGPVIVPKPESIISASKEVNFDITSLGKNAIFNGIKGEADKLGVSKGSIGNVRLTKGGEVQISPQEFFDTTLPLAPAGLVRSLEDFMVAVYGRETGAEPFLLFKTSSFELGFAGMLSWERTLSSDLNGLLTSTPGVFTDGFIKNRDVRMVKDFNGTVILLYAFLDAHTFIITSSEDVFIAALNQFTTNQLVR